MLGSTLEKRDEKFPRNPALRGYHAVYRENEVNHCPGCGHVQWLVGRVSAECSFCATALPLCDTGFRGTHRASDKPVFFQKGH